jgi:hypothetical protein
MKDLFAALYELITGQNDLAEVLYNAGNQYFLVGIVMLSLSLVGMVVYYYVINHPRFHRWFHWLLTITILGIINFAAAYFVANGAVYDLHGYAENITDIVMFGLTNVIWTFVFSFVFSMCIKWWSTNCKRTPF